MYDPITAHQYNESHRQQLWKDAEHERLVNSIDAPTLWEQISQIGGSLMARLQHIRPAATINEQPASLITSEHRVVRRV